MYSYALRVVDKTHVAYTTAFFPTTFSCLDMSSERVLLDERHVYLKSTPNGESIHSNCIERVPPEALLEESDVAFIGEIGYGVTCYDLPEGAIRCTDPHEMANRIAAVLPITTPHNTTISLLHETTGGGHVLLVWGNGSTDSGRLTRVSEIRAARLSALQKADESKNRSRLLTCAHINAIQPPLIHHSEVYRHKVGTLAIGALCGPAFNVANVTVRDTCVRQMMQRPADPHFYLLHDYYAKGTETMWLMHGPSRGATLYRQEERVETCACESQSNQGMPVRDKMRPESETDPIACAIASCVAVAGQPTSAYPALNGMMDVDATDAGVTRFVSAESFDANFISSRPIDMAQGLAGFRSEEFVSVCTVVGSPMAANGQLYGRIPIDHASCITHTMDVPGAHIVIPNTTNWLNRLFEISPDKSPLYFLGPDAGAIPIRDTDRSVIAYRVPRALMSALVV